MNDKWYSNALANKHDIVAKSTNNQIQYKKQNIEAYCNSLKEKTVVIIGGSLSAQELLITQFFMSGSNVFFLTTDINDGHKLARQLNDTDRNNRIKPVNCDITNQSQLQQRLEAINKLTGSVDILINNIVANDDSDSTQSTDIEALSMDYLQATLSSVADVYPFMKTKNAGTIINVHSAMSQKEVSKDIHCASIKGELTGITSGLASKMSCDNITVNSIILCLERTNNDEVDALNEIQGAYDIARLTVFLASDACCNMTGQVFVVSNHQ